MERVEQWFGERTNIMTTLRSWRGRASPDHWSLLLGQIAVASLIVCLLTGVFLAFFYDSSTGTVVYDGAYGPMRGVEMSRAFDSTLRLSLDTRGGLLTRQLHAWSSSLMIAALMLHILRVFFTGGFRKPRELTWVLLFSVLILGMAEGFTGHILPDDMLSGSSLAVLDGLLKAFPAVGARLSFLVFQGGYPSGAVTTFYPLHVILLPAVLVALVVVIGLLNTVHGPEQHTGPGRTERNIVGQPARATTVKSVGLFFIVAGALTGIAATVTVNPVWLYGPADPGNASAGGGALWYLAFLDGAQRLVPPGWEVHWAGCTWALAILVPLAVCAFFLLTAMIYPFIEAWITDDRQERHLLTRPRNAPTRTGIGVAGVVFYAVLWFSAASDLIAWHFSLSVEQVVLVLQCLLVLGPVIGFTIAKRVCLGLQRKDREIAVHGHESGRIVRMPGGGYAEVHQPVTPSEQWMLLSHESNEPLTLRPDQEGRIHIGDRIRVILSHWFFRDRVAPVTRPDRHVPDDHTPAPVTGRAGPDASAVS